MSNINIKDINNISDLQFAKSLGIWGGAFISYYVNKADVNDKYIERMQQLKLVRRYVDPEEYVGWVPSHTFNKKFGILSAIETFNNFDKIKLINATGVESFVKNHKFFIELDLLQKENTPEYLEHIFKTESDCLLNIFIDTISIKVSNDEELMKAAFEIFEFYDYNYVRTMENTMCFYLGIDEDVSFTMTTEEAEKREYDDIVSLYFLDEDIINSMAGWYGHIKKLVSRYDIINKYKRYGGDVSELADYVYENLVGSLIYFYEEGDRDIYNNDVTLGLGISPFFYYDGDKYESKEDLIKDIMENKC